MKSALKVIVSIFLILLVLFGIGFAALPLPGTIPILMYHFIDSPEKAAKDKNIVSRQSFERQMAFLRRFGYRVLTPDEFYAIKTGEKKPRGREILITFDDGNESFERDAFPVLQKYSFPAAIFVVSESVKRGLHGSMSQETLKKLVQSGLVTVGSHSKTHPLLSKMTDEQIEDELVNSKKDLEQMLGVPILDLAYPSGDVDTRVIETAQQAGYRMAFSTSYKKLKGIDEGLYSLERVKISRTSDWLPVFWFKVTGIYHSFKREWYHLRHRN